MKALAERLSVLAFALFILAVVLGVSYAAGYVIGKLLL